MALADLLERLERRADTPDPPFNHDEESAKPAPIQACTLDTPDTPQNGGHEREARTSNPGDKRIENVVAKLENNPSLRYALETHTDTNDDAVILTV